jgi:hypothetical protein
MLPILIDCGVFCFQGLANALISGKIAFIRLIQQHSLEKIGVGYEY